ncbi:MAG: ATP-binding protein [Phycisphaerae bacterium]|nr:hybrid sensor histidine kinase/response regulator [Tepidisphaeraceae bacterium]
MEKKKRHTILVVDDEADVVASVKDLLRLEYKVLGVTRAAEAMAVVEREPLDVVMTDQRMPEQSGVELLERVRERQPEATRLLFTGYADLKAVIDAINKGDVYRYITKPWDPDELLTIIREACGHHDLLVERRTLLDEVQAKNAQLEKANADLQRADQLKNAFIQVASHELRTPLTILTGVAHLAAMYPGSTGELGELLKRIQQAGTRMQHLINQIVTMLSMQQFERKPAMSAHNLARLVRRAADDVRPFVVTRRQTLLVDVPEELGDLTVDEEKIRDAVNHLLLNAVKFTPDGGTITVGARRQGEDGRSGPARIWVSDTGVGMDAPSVSRVFDTFFTSFDVSHHSSGHFEYGKKGLGLGLSVVKAFVEMHGGSVAVASEPGQGTTFTITLPGT